MNVYVLNENFDVTFVLDYYESFMWVDRYFDYGEFEIYAPFSSSYINNLIQGYYVQIDSSESTMIIENIQLKTDADTGSHLIIKGRSLESIIDRRVIYPTLNIKGSNCYLEKAIKIVLDDTIINPTRYKTNYKKIRKILNFDFVYLDEEEDWYYFIKNIPIDPVEITGDNVYDVIRNWCTDNDASFKITLGSDKRFKFKLYYGVDRSYNQGDNPENLYVIFSPEFNNIISTDYIDDISPWKNYAIIAGEGEGDNRKVILYGATDLDKDSGLNHRELFVDASDLQSSEIAETGYASYDDALIARGIEKLNENYKNIEFNGEVEAKRQFVYGRDFYIGDIVQLVNLYGITGSARVTEFVINETENGIEMYPTFEAIQNEGYNEEEGD